MPASTQLAADGAGVAQASCRFRVRPYPGQGGRDSGPGDKQTNQELANVGEGLGLASRTGEENMKSQRGGAQEHKAFWEPEKARCGRSRERGDRIESWGGLWGQTHGDKGLSLRAP